MVKNNIHLLNSFYKKTQYIIYMKSFPLFALLILLASCDEKNEPNPDIYMQIAEISDESSDYKINFSYDAYGRVVKYSEYNTHETIEISYSYPSADQINMHTRCVIPLLWDANGIEIIYDDQLYLDKGRASYCEGIYKRTENESVIEKKYRHDFTYTSDNHLNVVKCTEWNKLGDSWAFERPWTWENFYIWENGNLVEVEDYNGNNTPAYTYKYNYFPIKDVENIVAINMGRYQYYPLQLKGIFGSWSINLISSTDTYSSINKTSMTTDYIYDIQENRIISYTENRGGKSNVFSVIWIE